MAIAALSVLVGCAKQAEEETPAAVEAPKVEVTQKEAEGNKLTSGLSKGLADVKKSIAGSSEDGGDQKKALEAKLKDEQAKAEAQLKDEQAKAAASLEEEKAKATAKIAEEKATMAAKLEEEKAAAEAKIEEEKSNLTAEFTKQKDALMAQYAKQSSALSSQFGGLKSSYQKLKSALPEDTVNSLEAKIPEIDLSLEGLKNLTNKYSPETMEQLNSFKDKYSSELATTQKLMNEGLALMKKSDIKIPSF